MENLRWVTAHFSPTGTTVQIARAIARGAGLSSREIDLSAPVAPETIGEGEILLAAVPVFGGRVPAVALERLKQLKGNGQPAVAVAVYGNRAFEDALLELKDALEENGFQVVAGAAFVAEHSMVRSIAAGRPDGKDIKTAEDFGGAVREKLAQEKRDTVRLPGDSGYREKKRGGMPAHPAAGEDCVGCGTCARNCPVGAISMDALAQADPEKCINCMRCVSLCPRNARTLPAPMIATVTEMLQKVASEPKKPELFL